MDLNIDKDILALVDTKDLFSIKYYWDLINNDIRFKALNDCSYFDNYCKNLKEIGDKIDLYINYEFVELPTELQDELKNYGLSFKMLQEEYKKLGVNVNSKKELISFLSK